MPATSMTMNVMIASVAVTAMLPVGVEPHGMSPNRLQNRMKKKSVRTERHVALAAVPAEHRDVDLVAQVEDDRLEPGGESLRPADLARVLRTCDARRQISTMHRRTPRGS